MYCTYTSINLPRILTATWARAPDRVDHRKGNRDPSWSSFLFKTSLLQMVLISIRWGLHFHLAGLALREKAGAHDFGVWEFLLSLFASCLR